METKIHGKRRVAHAVEVDEARERLPGSEEVLGLEVSDGVDEIGEELGETFVENVTGADDAATEHRATDPVGAEREALPSVD